jgi:hypothetical protein
MCGIGESSGYGRIWEIVRKGFSESLPRDPYEYERTSMMCRYHRAKPCLIYNFSSINEHGLRSWLPTHTSPETALNGELSIDSLVSRKSWKVLSNTSSNRRKYTYLKIFSMSLDPTPESVNPNATSPRLCSQRDLPHVISIILSFRFRTMDALLSANAARIISPLSHYTGIQKDLSLALRWSTAPLKNDCQNTTTKAGSSFDNSVFACPGKVLCLLKLLCSISDLSQLIGHIIWKGSIISHQIKPLNSFNHMLAHL